MWYFCRFKPWVDAAIATSMVLSCESITQEKDHELIGMELWNQGEINKIISKADGQIRKINTLFSEEIAYLHPIKLSQFS